MTKVEDYTINEYLPALAQGAYLDSARRDEVAQQVAEYSGLTVEEVQQNNLDIANSFFWKALL